MRPLYKKRAKDRTSRAKRPKGSGAKYRRAVAAGGLFSAMIGLLSLIGWALGRPVLASLGVTFIPMAPSAAILLILSGTALLAQGSVHARRFGKVVGGVAGGMVLLFAAMVLVQFLARAPSSLEQWLLPSPALFEGVLTGRMSPITAMGFLLSGGALLLLLPSGPAGRHRRRAWAATFASLCVLQMAVVLCGYLYGTPLLYGATVIPVALPSAIAFLFLGAGLLALAGPRAFPLQPFVGPSARARLLRAFLPLTVIACLASGLIGRVVSSQLPINPALLGALSVIIAALVVSLIASRVARSVGNTLDQAQAQRRQSQVQLKRQFERLTALRAIDVAILSQLDLRLTLNIVIDQVAIGLGNHAVCILLYHPETQMLEYAAGRGFRSQAITRARLRLGEGFAGEAALQRRLVSIPDLRQAEAPAGTEDLLAGEGFVEYHAAPLIAKGVIEGVLEVYHREPLDTDPEWLEFLEALAGQAAIAVNNATLFEELQQSHAELVRAYDTTLEGWVKALDLRDHETEGHTQRVTDMTLRLARAMGVQGEDLAAIRRGALLHDIGKIGIPDHILLKPGPLTEEEWQIMRRHPVYAYEWLSPIAYLRPALEIPYCHHEKWDGAGYPRGLQGEEIPLEARIFAIVDVWDALRSDRPYRQAWPEEQAKAHIQSLAGIHFDPHVVEHFLELLADEAQAGAASIRKAA